MEKTILLLVLLVIVSSCAPPEGFEQKEPGGVIPSLKDKIVETPEPAAAPKVQGKIKGYWSSRAGMIIDELDDAEHMKQVGINTITFSPPLSHTQEGEVREFPGAESFTKKAINKAHEAGFRVMLETTPMNAGEVNPRVTNIELFQDEMTKIAVKYARIAEEYNVEYFAPIVEPVHHMGVQESDEWMQEVLPKIKEVYKGPIMWKKQSMHLTDPQEFNQDHILKIGFKVKEKNFNMKMKTTREHSILLDVGAEKISLEGWSGGKQKFKKDRLTSLDNSKWHLLKVEMQGQKIRIFLNDGLVIEHDDDSGPLGGYSIRSEDLRINKFEITDMSGLPLVAEDFKSLNHWNARSGWKLGDKEIIVTSNDDSVLIHDINFSGYDYIAIDTFRRGQAETSEHYLEFLEFVIDKTNDQAKSDNVPQVILAEFGGSVMEEVGWIDEDVRAKIPITEEELAQVTRKVLELAEEYNLDGYIYNGWDIEGQGINKIPEIEAVIKEWYNSH